MPGGYEGPLDSDSCPSNLSPPCVEQQLAAFLKQTSERELETIEHDWGLVGAAQGFRSRIARGRGLLDAEDGENASFFTLSKRMVDSRSFFRAQDRAVDDFTLKGVSAQHTSYIP
jgi:hypothetical protein